MLSEKYGRFKDWLFKVDENSSRTARSGHRDGPDEPRKSTGTAHLNSDKEFTYVDETFLDLFSYDHTEEIVDEDWKEVYGEEAVRLENEVLPGLREGNTWKGKATVVGRDGEEVPHRLSLTKTTGGGIVCEVCELEPSSREEVEIDIERREQRLMTLSEGLVGLQDPPSKYEVYSTSLKVLQNTLDPDFCVMNVEEDDLCLVKGETDDLSTSSCDLYACIEKLSKKARRSGEVISGDELGTVMGTNLASKTNYSYISAPIEEVGVLQVFSLGKNPFTEVDEGIMEIMSHYLHERIIRSQLEGDVKDQAIHDQLTGLYNRHYLDKILAKEVERSRRYGHFLGFLMADINNFKDVNDRYSHATGDQVLIQIGKIFRENVREPDTVIRYGGDEFLVLMPETRGGLEVVVQRLRDQTHSWSQETDLIHFTLTLSIGVAKYDSNGEQAVDQVIKKADEEMYEDKNL